MVVYELTHQRAELLIGYVMLKFYECKKTRTGWEVYLVFNRKITKIKLDERYFKNDQKPEEELYQLMESIDRNHSNLGKSSDDPVFFSRSPYKLIPMQYNFNLSIQEMMENLDNVSSNETFWDKMKEVFG